MNRTQDLQKAANACGIPLLVITAFLASGLTPIRPQPAGFEVVSIRPTAAGTPEGITMRQLSGGILNVAGYPLPTLMQLAFEAKPFKFIGVPKWVASARYDISARTALPASAKQMWPMLLPVLQDRFKLQFHRELKSMAVFELSISQNGKLPLAKEDGCIHLDANGLLPLAGGGRGGPTLICDLPAVGPVQRTGRHVYGGSVRMATFISELENLLARPVVDKTGLVGAFDLDLSFTPDSSTPALPSNPSADAPTPFPNIFTAIQEQMGLKLKPANDPIEVIVIDRIEPPTEN